MTGKYPSKTGVTDWIPGRHANRKARPYEKFLGAANEYQLVLRENTIAEQVLQSGYKTFFAGKWHLGETEEFWPEAQGFQTNIGGWSKGGPTGKVNDTTGGFFTPYNNPKLPDGPVGEFLEDRLTDECHTFLNNVKAEPFLMLYSLYAVHNPMQAPTALVKKYERKREGILKQGETAFAKDEPWMQYENGWKRRTVQEHAVYAAMVENMDTNIGRILAKLKEKGLYENTIIIFTSDNGGLSTAEGSPTVNSPLRNGKGWLYEGGIRVPFIMYWKGKVVENHTTDLPITVADIFPTIAKAVNQKYKPAADIDGRDILTLTADSAKQKDRTIYWHYPHYSNQGGKPGAVIRQGNWKLIYNYEDESIELYNLLKDVGERTDLSNEQKELAASLKNKLMHWLTEKKAKGPDKNPEYGIGGKPK